MDIVEHRRIRLRAIATGLVMSMTVAACGDPSSDVAQSATTGATTASTVAPASSATQEDPVSGPESASEFCSFLEDEEAVRLDYSDPAQLEEGVAGDLERMEAAAGAAPDDLQDDMELILERFREFIAALEEAEWDLFAVSESDPRVSGLEEPDAREAFARVGEECAVSGRGTVGSGAGSGDAIDADVPQILIPPGAGDVLSETPLLTIAASATYQELVSYYADVFGSVTSESEEQATFVGQVEGSQTAVWVIKDPDHGVVVTISR